LQTGVARGDSGRAARDATRALHRALACAWCMALGACASGRDADATAAQRPAHPAAPAVHPAAPAARATPGAAQASRAATAELLQRLAPALSRNSAGLQWVDAGGGVRSLDLAGRFQHAALAVRGKDGIVRTTCVDRLQAAEAVLREANTP
jgi:hypothetical protein